MDDILRHALYLVPDGPLGAWGAAWLGWDLAAGRPLPMRDDPPDWAAITATPRRYGFHATLKPPFRLAEGATPAALDAAVRRLCAGLAPVRLAGLRIASLDGCLALLPQGDTGALDAMAARIVADLDPFRRPAPPEETARRRAAGLSARQEAYLSRWGYPYVMDAFQAHFTLTDRLPPDRAAAVAALLDPPLGPLAIDSIALVGEQAAGGFRVLHRYALSG